MTSAFVYAARVYAVVGRRARRKSRSWVRPGHTRRMTPPPPASAARAERSMRREIWQDRTCRTGDHPTRDACKWGGLLGERRVMHVERAHDDVHGRRPRPPLHLTKLWGPTFVSHPSELRVPIVASSSPPPHRRSTAEQATRHKQTPSSPPPSPVLFTMAQTAVRNLIHGHQPAHFTTYDVVHPAHGTVHAVEKSTETDVFAAIGAAHRASLSWRQTSLSERTEIVRRAADLLADDGTGWRRRIDDANEAETPVSPKWLGLFDVPAFMRGLADVAETALADEEVKANGCEWGVCAGEGELGER